ncbi:MAG TPA: thiamine-phosphate kinase [Gemmatimonadales bacterium]|nr:thiamine-phosphate kinase [Gemmatimonadales bacterium]
MTHTPLGPGPEFDRIRAIAAALGADAGELGDDCALVSMSDGTLALSTDVSVEGVHFRREWLSLEEIGWRAAAAALSDLAAEGAGADGVLVALTLPSDASESDATEVMRGVGAAARSVRATVRGGDLSSGPAWSVAVTVFGMTERPVTRIGARPGDELWVTGQVGGAGAALALWQAGRGPSEALRRRFAHPEPRIATGRWLAAHGATAMLDLSDGVVADAQHLAAASGVKLRIELDALPLAVGVTDPRLAAVGGEDYELLVALPAGFAGREECLHATGVSLTPIGRVLIGAGVECTLEGRPILLTGYQHFR